MRGAIAQADRPADAEDREDGEDRDEHARNQEAQVRDPRVVLLGHLLHRFAEAPLGHDVRTDVARRDGEQNADEGDDAAFHRTEANQPGGERHEDDRADRSEDRVPELREEHILLKTLDQDRRLALVLDPRLDQALGGADSVNRLLHTRQADVVPQDQGHRAQDGSDVVEFLERNELAVLRQLGRNRERIDERGDEEPVRRSKHPDDAGEDHGSHSAHRGVAFDDRDSTVGQRFRARPLEEHGERRSDEESHEADERCLEGPVGAPPGENEHAARPEDCHGRDLERHVRHFLGDFADFGELLTHAVRAGARECVDAVGPTLDRGHGCGARMPPRVAGRERIDERNACAHEAAGMLVRFALDHVVRGRLCRGDATHLPVTIVLERAARSRHHTAHFFEDLERRLVDALEQSGEARAGFALDLRNDVDPDGRLAAEDARQRVDEIAAGLGVRTDHLGEIGLGGFVKPIVGVAAFFSRQRRRSSLRHASSLVPCLRLNSSIPSTTPRRIEAMVCRAIGLPSDECSIFSAMKRVTVPVTVLGTELMMSAIVPITPSSVRAAASVPAIQPVISASICSSAALARAFFSKAMISSPFCSDPMFSRGCF